MMDYKAVIIIGFTWQYVNFERELMIKITYIIVG